MHRRRTAGNRTAFEGRCDIVSFNVNFWYNKSEPNRLDKDLVSVNISQQSCVFKQSSSIMSPTLILQYANDSSASRYFRCNYITIGDPINRNYFVEEINILANKLVEFRCRIDVLTTYKDAIRANKAIIQRQETNWNLYLNDGSFKIYQNPMVVTKVFPNGFPTPKYFLTVAGGLST